MAERDDVAGNGKSGVARTRGCFLLLWLVLLLLNEANCLSPHRHSITLGSFNAKFRGSRSAFMPPTVTSLSPPSINPKRRQQPRHPAVGISTTSFSPPGVVSRSPSTRSQVSNSAGPASMPTQYPSRKPTWMLGGGSRSPQPTAMGFDPHRTAKGSSSRGSPTPNDGVGGWSNIQTVNYFQPRMPPKQVPHTFNTAGPTDRNDTHGLDLTENLSHVEAASSSRREMDMAAESPSGTRVWEESQGSSRTVFNGGSHQPRVWWYQDQSADQRDVKFDNGRGVLLDIDTTSEYQTEDYNANHEYDENKNTWANQEPEHPSVVEEGYQHDVSLETNGKTDDTNENNKERSRKNRKKDRRGQRKRGRNRKRKGKKGQRNNITSTPAPDSWESTTTSVLPQATTDTIGIVQSSTEPSMSDTLSTSTMSVTSSGVSIVSMTLGKASSDPKLGVPVDTTLVENAVTPNRQNTHITPNLWGERKPVQIPPSNLPPSETEKTINEIDRVNFVREKMRDDYVFPLRGLLIISGLMGALAVFTLVILISYAAIKCSKKPAVNNYQVSEQQKAAGT